MKRMVFALVSTLLIYSGELKAQDSDVKNFVDSKKNFKEWESGWKKGAFLGVNYTSVGLSNWSAGGQTSVSISSLANLFAHNKKGKGTWENYVDLAYGVLKTNDPPREFQKNEDKIDLLSKYGRKLSGKWNYATLLNLKSQLAPGFDFSDPNPEKQHISNLLAPAYGLASMGFDYRPKDYFTIFMSPITGKFTIVAEERLANLGYFGVKPAVTDTLGNILKKGEQLRTELGWYVKVMFGKDVMKNINVQSRLDLFNNYDDLGQIDINWETTLNMKVNKFITTTFFAHLIYDNDIDTDPGTPAIERRIQFKNVLGVGVSYKLGDTM